ncbi:helix-turn-helix domain-containing protein [Amycolatopsis sp. FU40]|uniref:helix-turn-helix transcriptional regulator n=1 Tax=Amycolatopsis sp. FU40 TaxID=2914159 RepID=UPI001F3D1D4A|nr:helix-turn-helix transcriptional regulator [Amycolatopsis sp. FU40]UKD55138.1 helix-turn-helix domain-containing protein [Amycolatopsis sp. FU40]
MSPDDTPTADEIRQARLTARLTRSAMAGRIGVSEQSLKNWETGKSRPSQPSLQRFREAVNRISISDGSDEVDEPQRWRMLRERAGMTVQQMGIVMGVPADTVAAWEQPKVYPNVTQRARYDAMQQEMDATLGPDGAVPNRWRQARDDAGMSREDVAAALSSAGHVTSKKDVWDFETGVREPSLTQAAAYGELR